jgi:LuxR family maltose regulon positive regulatory protein
MWLADDRLEDAFNWMREQGLPAEVDTLYLDGLLSIALARILIAQGSLEKAARVLQHLLEAAEAGGHITRVIELLILRAMVFQAEGDTVQAMITLEKALSLAEPGGFFRIFVDEGPPMARLLYRALSGGISPDYVRRLLAAFPVSEPDQVDQSQLQASRSELIEPLSERELEVLQLIAEGLTNPEIASRLFITLNTVKAHSRNIYGKLGVRNRTHAVAKGRTLGILPSN